jgi:hypothetical protein
MTAVVVEEQRVLPAAGRLAADFVDRAGRVRVVQGGAAALAQQDARGIPGLAAVVALRPAWLCDPYGLPAAVRMTSKRRPSGSFTAEGSWRALANHDCVNEIY